MLKGLTVPTHPGFVVARVAMSDVGVGFVSPRAVDHFHTPLFGRNMLLLLPSQNELELSVLQCATGSSFVGKRARARKLKSFTSSFLARTATSCPTRSKTLHCVEGFFG